MVLLIFEDFLDSPFEFLRIRVLAVSWIKGTLDAKIIREMMNEQIGSAT